MLISSEICATLTPNKAGAIRRTIFWVPESCQLLRSSPHRQAKRGTTPILRKAGICTANCNTPPAITPTAMAKIGSIPRACNSGARPQAAAMVHRLSRTGVAAGTAKRR